MSLSIALVTGPDAGHAFPVFAIAAELRRRGHQVLVCTGSQWQLELRRSDLPFAELPLLAPTPRDRDFGFRIWGRAAEMAPPLRDLLAPHAPDIVVADTLTRAGGFAAELLGVPWVETSPHYVSDPADDLPPIGLGARHPRTPVGRLVHGYVRAEQRASRSAGDRLRWQARAALSLTGDGGPLLRLHATLPALEYARTRWPEDSYLVGALEWEPPWESLEPPPGDEPLVLVSDSTASTVELSVARLALSALASTSRPDLRVVATTGRQLDGPRPRRSVVGRGPHGPLLDEASVVVAPGGHGLVTKALKRGVPLVLVPLQGDQRETARRVEVAGLGLAVWRPSRARIRRAVREVLRDGAYRTRAAEAARTAADLGATRAADLVELAYDRAGVTSAAGRRGDARR